MTLKREQCTGWVVAQVIDEYANETRLAEQRDKETFQSRIQAAGLHGLIDGASGPRARCQALSRAEGPPAVLLDEAGQRCML